MPSEDLSGKFELRGAHSAPQQRLALSGDIRDGAAPKMNRLIRGDNLLAMHALLATGYEGKTHLRSLWR